MQVVHLSVCDIRLCAWVNVPTLMLLPIKAPQKLTGMQNIKGGNAYFVSWEVHGPSPNATHRRFAYSTDCFPLANAKSLDLPLTRLVHGSY